MKKSILSFVGCISMLASNVCYSQNDSAKLAKQEAHKWFQKKEWLQGLPLKPNESIDETTFANQYKLNKKYWDEAFAFLKAQDLQAIGKGKYVIDGDNVFASVTIDSSKNFDKTNWESHKKYIDVQLILMGEEKMGVHPVANSKVIKEYDAKRDAANYETDGKFYVAGPNEFFIFFPADAHRPNITPGGNLPVKKLVIKVRFNDGEMAN